MKYGDKVTDKDRTIAQQFSTYKDLPNWPRFDPAWFDLMDFTLKGPLYGREPRAGVALVEKIAERRTTSQNQQTDLRGTSWQLVRFQGSNDSILMPDDRAKYTIAWGLMAA